MMVYLVTSVFYRRRVFLKKREVGRRERRFPATNHQVSIGDLVGETLYAARLVSMHPGGGR
jgi:hypothetical protein